MSVRVRFAPSPTGRLHLGNVRIAAFNWLFARKQGGRLVLRIEDTDTERTLPGSEQAILEDLRWLGLDWDEGPDVGGPHAPYRQSEREPFHRAAVEELIARGRAYRCWCTPDELARHKSATTGGQVLRYPGTCRELAAERRTELERSGRSSVVRFHLPPGDTVTVEDAVRGTVVFPMSDLDDFVLLRGDGRATYNLAVVVDDIGQAITHVIRGAGHLSNTHKQALLFDALGRYRPVFAHLPTVLGPDGHPLSKRQRSQSVGHLREEGYHPDAVVNYLSLLGWSSPDGREVFSRDELIARTSLDRLGAVDATALDPEKLRWMSGQHIAAMGLDQLVAAVRPWIAESGVPDAALPAIVAALRSRLHRFGELGEHLGLIHPPEAALDQARSELRSDPSAVPVLAAVRSRLAAEASWDAARLGDAVRAAGKEAGAGGPKLFHPVRRALTASTSGPDLGLVLAALGREEALARLAAAIPEV